MGIDDRLKKLEGKIKPPKKEPGPFRLIAWDGDELDEDSYPPYLEWWKRDRAGFLEWYEANKHRFPTMKMLDNRGDEDPGPAYGGEREVD